MDLLSLPDEMLASVLKFSKFETIVRLRKTNARIDKVTVRYGINKPKCFVLEAQPDRLIVKHRTTDMEDQRRTRFDHQQHIFPCSDPFSLMEMTLKKVRNVERIVINRQHVDMVWLELLFARKRKHRTEVTLMRCTYKVSLDDLKQVLSKFKKVKFYMSTDDEIIEERVTTDKAVCFILSFAELVIGVYETARRLPAITDKTLKMLQTNLPKEFTICLNCANFTLSEVIKTFKIEITNPCEPRLFWNLGKVKVNSLEELDRAFNELSSIRGIRITDKRSEDRRMKVWLKQSNFQNMVTIEM